MTTGALRYDALIFDVGGTLIGFHDWLPFQEFLATAGLPASEDDARRLQREFHLVLVAERDSAQGLGADGADLHAWWRRVFHKLWPDRPDLAEEMFVWLDADRFDRVYADVIPALEALRGLGVPLAVVSNFTDDLDALLRRLDLRGYFEPVIVSAEVGLAKPDPRIFDLAVSHLGHPRHRLLYVGDHVGDDVGGAQAAGLDVVLIDRSDRLRQAPCARIRSLEDLPAYIRPPTWPSRGILFDLDGVVIESFSAHLAAWQEVLGPLSIHMTADDLAPLEGLPTEPMARLLIAKLLGHSLPDEDVRRLAVAKRDAFIRQYRPQAMPGAVPLLHNLRGRGYRLALVTGSAPGVVAEILPEIGVAHLFDVIITAADVSRGKPDAEPYATAAARLGLAPADCLAVENAPLGVRSAKAAGMSCLAVETTLRAECLPGADLTFPDLSALAAWLLAPWRLSF